jgi:hypothetical protein
VATAEVTMRVEIVSDEVTGWQPRDRKDLEALIDQEAQRVFNMKFSQGTAWSAYLTRSGDAEVENWLMRLVGKIRPIVPRDIELAVIHDRRWAIDPFGPLIAETAYARPEFAPDGPLFGVEPDEVYVVIAVRSQQWRARPDANELVRDLAKFVHPSFSPHTPPRDVCMELSGSEDDARLGTSLVGISEHLRSRGFPTDLRLDVAIERSWWVEVFRSAEKS